MFNFFGPKKSDTDCILRIEQLESKIARMQVQIEMLKTELLILPVKKGLGVLNEQISAGKSSEKDSCCESGCSMTPNCPRGGAVF